MSEIPVKTLYKRYHVAASALYKRMRDLGVTPSKRGNRSYITRQQLELMDELDAHIKDGGTTKDFRREKTEQGEIRLDPVEAIAQDIQVIKSFLGLLVVNSAVKEGWLLTSDQIKNLLGIEPVDGVTSQGFRVVAAGEYWRIEHNP